MPREQELQRNNQENNMLLHGEVNAQEAANEMLPMQEGNVQINQPNEMQHDAVQQQELNVNDHEFVEGEGQLNLQNVQQVGNQNRVARAGRAPRVKFSNLSRNLKDAYKAGSDSLKEYLSMRKRLLKRHELRDAILEESEKQIEEKRLLSVYKDKIYRAFTGDDGEVLKEYLDESLQEEVKSLVKREEDSVNAKEQAKDSFMDLATQEALEMDQSKQTTNNVSVDYVDANVNASPESIRKIDQWILHKAKDSRIEFVQELLSLSFRERTVIYYLIEKKRRKEPNVSDIRYACKSYEPNIDDFTSAMTTTAFKFWRFVPGVSRMYWNKLTDGFMAIKNPELREILMDNDLLEGERPNPLQQKNAGSGAKSFADELKSIAGDAKELGYILEAYEAIKTLEMDNIFKPDEDGEFDEFEATGDYKDFKDGLSILKSGLGVFNYIRFIKNGGFTDMFDDEATAGTKLEAFGTFAQNTLGFSIAGTKSVITVAKTLQYLATKFDKVSNVLNKLGITDTIKMVAEYKADWLEIASDSSYFVSSVIDVYTTSRDIYRKHKFNKASQQLNNKANVTTYRVGDADLTAEQIINKVEEAKQNFENARQQLKDIRAQRKLNPADPAFEATEREIQAEVTRLREEYTKLKNDNIEIIRKAKYEKNMLHHTDRVKNTQMVEHSLDLVWDSCDVTGILVSATGIGAIATITGTVVGLAVTKSVMYFLNRGDKRSAVDHFLGIPAKLAQLSAMGKSIDIDVLRRSIMAKLGFAKLENFYHHVIKHYAKFILDNACREIRANAGENDRPYVDIINSLGLKLELEDDAPSLSLKSLTGALLGN